MCGRATIGSGSRYGRSPGNMYPAIASLPARTRSPMLRDPLEADRALVQRLRPLVAVRKDGLIHVIRSCVTDAASRPASPAGKAICGGYAWYENGPAAGAQPGRSQS